MNLEFLRAIAAIADHTTLVAAADALGLSHSAVSLRIKALEEQIGQPILDRQARPVRLTPIGLELLNHARDLERITTAVRDVGRNTHLRGLLRIGAVPTTLTHLVPPALTELRLRHPEIEFHVQSGLSGELALALRQGDIDAALVSEPALGMDGVDLTTITTEPLVMIASAAQGSHNWRALLRDQPFIWFNRKTWAGQLIERHLLTMRLAVRGQMEVDSLEAITAMVRHGLGVSIVPKRTNDAGQFDHIRQFSLDDPGLVRRLVLLRPPRDSKARLTDALIATLRDAASSTEHEMT